MATIPYLLQSEDEEKVYSQDEIKNLLEEADLAIEDLDKTLSSVQVTIPAKAAEVVKAVVMLFGEDRVRSDGSVVITHKMFTQVSDILKRAGKLKVEEYV